MDRVTIDDNTISANVSNADLELFGNGTGGVVIDQLKFEGTEIRTTESNADLTYEGEIVEYRISPTTATANNTAAQNRLTVGINIRFYDKNDSEAEFEKRFSFSSRSL